MNCIDIRSQDEYDAHKDDKDACLHLVAGYYPVISSGSVEWVTGSGSVGRVTGSGRVEWVDGSGSVGRVTGSGRVGRVDGSGSVEAAGTSVVHAYGGTVKAGKYATVYQHDDSATITGGNVIKAPAAETLNPAEWAEYSGVELDGDTLIVYKAVDENLASGHGMSYPIGQEIVAPDWRTVQECGNGLHFSPRPVIAGSYLDGRKKRYLRCAVKTSDAVVIDATKIKARACVVLCEVDISGTPLPGPQQ